jgi:hypothetical protein
LEDGGFWKGFVLIYGEFYGELVGRFFGLLGVE